MRCLFVVCSATCRGAQEQWRVGVCSCPGARAHQPQEGVGDAAMHGQLPGSRGQSTVTRQQLQKGGKAARLLRRLRRGVERPMAPTSVDEGRGAYLVHHRSEVQGVEAGEEAVYELPAIAIPAEPHVRAGPHLRRQSWGSVLLVTTEGVLWVSAPAPPKAVTPDKAGRTTSEWAGHYEYARCWSFPPLRTQASWPAWSTRATHSSSCRWQHPPQP